VETVHASAFPFIIRVVLMMVGALLLWYAPASVVGIMLMLIGLVCAVAGLTLHVSVVR
jgi:hypothetical protein